MARKAFPIWLAGSHSTSSGTIETTVAARWFEDENRLAELLRWNSAIHYSVHLNPQWRLSRAILNAITRSHRNALQQVAEPLISAPPSARKIFWGLLTLDRLQQQFRDFAIQRGRNLPKGIYSQIDLFAFKLGDGNTLKAGFKGEALL